MSSYTVSLLGSERLRARFVQLLQPDPALVRGMENVSDRIVRKTMEDKLSGQVLKVRTGRLRRSITRRIETVGSDLEGIVGTNVEYARIHEFGGVIHHPSRPRTIRHLLTASGELARQAGHPNLARFARRSHTNAREMLTTTRAYDQHLPARSFLRSSLNEMRGYAETRLRQALQEAIGR